MKPERQLQLFQSVQELIEKAQQSNVRYVNTTMVATYFQIGRMIVEDEQQRKAYATYGKETITKLSQHLTALFGRGYSPDSLERMRAFFVTYGNYETLSRNSDVHITNSATVLRNLPAGLNLSWSHYIILLKIKDGQERKFYELEATSGNWSVRESNTICTLLNFSILSV